MNRITFHTPPGWPTPPEGYLPAADWRPDASWPPAPAGFQFYRDAYGYPTPPPPEYWQPGPLPDWSARAAAGPEETPPVAAAPPDFNPGTVPVLAPKRRIWPWLVGLLVLSLLATGGVLGWRYWNRADAPPNQVASVSELYNPPLTVGTAQYVLVGEESQELFKGSQPCIPKANAAVKPAQQLVLAGTDRGWAAATWRFRDTAAASKAWQELQTAIDGCTSEEYTFTDKRSSVDPAEQWHQFSQKKKDGTDHGRVVLTADANTVTWIEGGREDMGQTAFKAIRKRLAELD
ncbi:MULTISPECIES: hypothetical protein [unclassified Luteococcus]|uniref:hypothetical protein n=1 Tax=unclassified Luteococcus TaxID=2639923 RepID=UPI00313AA063